MLSQQIQIGSIQTRILELYAGRLVVTQGQWKHETIVVLKSFDNESDSRDN